MVWFLFVYYCDLCGVGGGIVVGGGVGIEVLVGLL